MIDKKDFQKAAEILKNANSILITGHSHPDADALGTQLAFAKTLKNLGKTIYCISFGEINRRLVELYKEDLDLLKMNPRVEDLPKQLDCFLVVDVPTKKRIGSLTKMMGLAKTSICIDHHRNHERFADYNLVDENASSAAEMSYYVIEQMGAIDPASALYLYSGIASDTYNFSYSSTAPSTHEVAAKLLAAGVNPDKVSTILHRKQTRAEIQIRRMIMEKLNFSEDGKTCSILVTEKMCEDAGVKMKDIDEMTSLPRDIEGVQVGIFAREYEDILRCSFRSGDEVDVAEFCQLHGGGGHKKAAGCRVNRSKGEPIEPLFDNLVQDFYQFLGNRQ